MKQTTQLVDNPPLAAYFDRVFTAQRAQFIEETLGEECILDGTGRAQERHGNNRIRDAPIHQKIRKVVLEIA